MSTTPAPSEQIPLHPIRDSPHEQDITSASCAVQPFPTDAVPAARQVYIDARISIHHDATKAIDQIFKLSISTGNLAFGKLHRDDFLSAFAPKMTWDVDQQFGGWRDDDPSKRKTSISPEEVWDLYWHPLVWHDGWVRLPGHLSSPYDNTHMHAEWKLIGYARLPHKTDRWLAYTAHIEDEYTILPNGRLVVSKRIWRIENINLPNHYVTIRRPYDVRQWTSVGEREHPRYLVVIMKIVIWILNMRRWMAPMVSVAALAASVQNTGISGCAGIVLAVLGIFAAALSLFILMVDYINNIVTYVHGSLVKGWVRQYNVKYN